MDEILRRVSDHLEDVASALGRIDNAVGLLLQSAGNVSPAVQCEVQSIDRVAQEVNELCLVLRFVRSKACNEGGIDLSGLGDKLNLDKTLGSLLRGDRLERPDHGECELF